MALAGMKRIFIVSEGLSFGEKIKNSGHSFKYITETE